MYSDSEHLSNPSAEQSIETKAIQTYTERKMYSRSHPSIPKLPVISLILGLVLFIIAITFYSTSGSSTNIWILLGAAGFLVFGPPSIYCIKSAYGTNVSRARQVTPDFIKRRHNLSIILGLLGVAMLMFGIGATQLQALTGCVISAAASFTGTILLYLFCKISGYRNGESTMLLFSIRVFLIAAYRLASFIVPDYDFWFRIIFLLPAGLLLLFYPLYYRLIKRIQCTEIVEAKCIRIRAAKHLNQQHSGASLRYFADWAYSYLDYCDLHTDPHASANRTANIGDVSQLFVDPNFPFHTYRKKAPLPAISSYLCVWGLMFSCFSILYSI